ncbi:MULTISPECIES: sensor histidine kinase [Gracilibacillus]|uniref:sensor histidine kinase n=1 Tax=Gracilibacillus TaxID=74385 RepID=UPI0008262D3E|nr:MULTISPECIES: histidine kinase [Gracilibacillus]
MRKFVPATLKNKLIVSFLVFILLPFVLLNVYNFWNFEKVLKENVIQQSNNQVHAMNQTLEDLMGMTFRSLTLLRQDSTITNILKNPEEYSIIDRHQMINTKFESISNSFFLSSPSIYYTILDNKENVYTSFAPRISNKFNDLVKEPWYNELMQQEASYYWSITDDNYVHSDISKSEYFLTLFAEISGNQRETIGVVRISIDFSEWFNTLLSGLPEDQAYFIMEGDGEIILQSEDNIDILMDTVDTVLSRSNKEDYYFTENAPYFVSYNYLDNMDWYMVSLQPLDVMYNNIHSVERNYYVPFTIFMVIFISITLLISTKFTAPLKHLQSKMATVTQGDLSTELAEADYSGELKELVQHFNKMMRDLETSTEELKIEERQKEAMKYKMLLSQVNPHFLNNTLNTIKWIALKEDSKDIEEICVSLGKILEKSLANEIELIKLYEEIDLLNSYIYIQNYRYKGKYKVHYYIEEDVQHALVLKFSLQPIVENTIYHAFPEVNKGNISINIYTLAKHLFIEISDDGIGFEEAKKNNSRGTGVGLKNLEERLRLLFKEEADLTIDSSSKGTKVTLCIPLLMTKPYQEGKDH